MCSREIRFGKFKKRIKKKKKKKKKKRKRMKTRMKKEKVGVNKVPSVGERT